MFKSFSHFLIGLFVFLALSCMSCLYILEINPLLIVSFAIIFSYSEGCLFTLFRVSFAMQKLLSFIRSYLFTFVFISVTLGGNVEETKVEWFYEYLQDLLEHQKKILFIIGDWNAKAGNQEIPGVTGKLGLGVQNEAGERLTVISRECTGHSKHPLPTTQEKTLHMDITRWSIPKSD